MAILFTGAIRLRDSYASRTLLMVLPWEDAIAASINPSIILLAYHFEHDY